MGKEGGCGRGGWLLWKVGGWVEGEWMSWRVGDCSEGWAAVVEGGQPWWRVGLRGVGVGAERVDGHSMRNRVGIADQLVCWRSEV